LTFFVNSLVESFTITVFPVESDEITTFVSFTGNTARSGGGALHFDRSNENILVLKHTLFEKNIVLGGGGGAVSLFSENKNIFFYACIFLHNTAWKGGAVYIDTGNMIFQLWDCLLEWNSADESGGAIYLSSNNGDGVLGLNKLYGLGLYHTTCRRNSAYSFGGCIYAYQFNIIDIEYCIFSNNTGISRSGGGIFQATGQLRMIGSVLNGNTAGENGGAIFMQNSLLEIKGPKDVVEPTIFINNAALNGGAIFLNQKSRFQTFGYVAFLSNRAVRFGGAFRSSDSFISINEPLRPLLYNAIPRDTLQELYYTLVFLNDFRLPVLYGLQEQIPNG
jgi:predicted outer membrane repeat protein